MPTIPSGTKFMGVNPDVNTDERRSQLSNSYQDFYTIDEIVAEASAADTNIYNSDGTLDGNRTVTMNSNTLLFDGTNSDVKYTPNSTGGYLQLEGKASGVPRFSVSIPPYLTKPLAGFQLGMRAWDDATFPGYGKIGDAFFYAGNETNGLNFMNPVGTGTEDYIRFYAGNNASATSDIHIQGTGATRGNIGIGTEAPTEKLEVNGKTKTTTFQMTTAPVAGYVLTSDASGNGTWSAAAGSSSGRFGIADSNGAYTYYTTLQAAITAASAYQTVEMFADVTDATSTPVELKVYVNINGNGHTYNHTSNSGATFTITDTAGTKSGDINLYNFNIKRTTTASSGNPIFTASSSYTYLYNTFNFYGCKVSYTSTSGATPCFDGGNLSAATINGLDFTSNGSGNAISTAYLVDVNNSIINCTGTSTGINSTGTIKNCIINVTSGIGINTSTPYECTVFASTSGTCFRTPVAYNCTAFSNTGYCFDGSYLGVNTVYNCIARTTSGVGYWSSNCISSSAFATTGKTIDLHYNYGADTYKFYNNFFYASTAPAVDISSVTIMDSSIFCGWNSASGHGIRMSGTTGVISNNIIDVSNTSANCINSAAASTLKYSINTFKGATTSVNANVTQGMINTQDNKGNIVI